MTNVNCFNVERIDQVSGLKTGLRLFFSAITFVTLAGLTACSSSVREGEEPATLQDVDSVLEVAELWSYDVGDGPDAGGYKLRPFAVGDFLFVASRDGNLASLNVKDGSERWVIETNELFSAGPTLGDGVVIVGTDQGRMLAYKATTGEQLWTADLPSEVLAPPVIEKKMVIVNAADGNVLGYSLATGKRVWSQQQILPNLTLRGSSTPIAVGGAVFAGFDNGKIGGFDPETGQPFFMREVAVAQGRTQIERMVDINADIVSDGRNVFAASYQGKVARINLNSGKTDWSVDKSVSSGIALGRRDLFVTDDKSHISALSLTSGTQLWSNDTLRYRDVTGPAVVRDKKLADVAIVADKDGYVHFLEGRKGAVLARQYVGDSVWVQPVSKDRNVYIYSEDGELTAYRIGEASESASSKSRASLSNAQKDITKEAEKQKARLNAEAKRKRDQAEAARQAEMARAKALQQQGSNVNRNMATQEISKEKIGQEEASKQKAAAQIRAERAREQKRAEQRDREIEAALEGVGDVE